MKFRSKVFLSILLPAVLLLGVAMGVSLDQIYGNAEAAANGQFDRLAGALKGVLKDLEEKLAPIEEAWSGPRFQALVLAGVRSGDVKALEDRIFEQHQFLRFFPDYFAVRNSEGDLVLRRSSLHQCGSGCDHPLEDWALHRPRALVGVDGEPFLVVRVDYEDGEAWYLFGSRVRKDLDRLTTHFDLHLILRFGEETVYTTLPEWRPELGSEGNIYVGKSRYLARRIRQSPLDIHILMLRSMAEVDREQRRVMEYGIGGLVVAILIATLVSMFISSGVSRPVEILVGATQRVGEGDFDVHVDIAGRDEMGRLGRAFNDMTDGLRKRKDIMERTLSRDVADEAMRGIELGGVQCDVTVLFMDIRGFTHATEGVDPADVVEMVNDMMKPMAEAVDRHGGNVNKYLGDGLMAMFGAPRPLEGHASRAVKAALEMQNQMEAFNQRRAGHGRPQMKIGIGINSGTVVGGYVGSEKRLEYTLMGEEVNLASRICGKASPGQILVTGMTLGRLGSEFETRELAPLQVKGLSYPIRVHEVVKP